MSSVRSPLRSAPYALVALSTLYAVYAQPVDRTRVDAAVHKAMQDWGVPGAAVAIVRGDDVLLVQGYGVKALGHTDPVTANTLFAIGSTTKAFTTAAMAMLVDEGKMNWDDPVRKYIEFFHLSDPMADQMVTLRDLVCHRTGISRNDILWYNSPWSSEDLIRKIAFLKPSRPFRTTWQYNNLMFLTAGYAVSKAAGTSWQDFIQKRIFDPLDMATADCSTRVAEKSPDHASPHRKMTPENAKPGETATPNVISWYNLDNIQPAGAINASAQDLAKWMQFQLSDGTVHGTRLISARNMAEMHTAQMVMRPDDWGREFNPETHQMSYGMAWMIHDYRGLHLVSHGGAIDGFRANITLLPDQKTGIAVLSNLDQENMPEALRYTLVDLVLGLPERDRDKVLMAHFGDESKRETAAAKKFADSRIPNTRPSRDLASYGGEYSEPAYGTAVVKDESNALTIAWSNYRASLEHFHLDTFRVKNSRLAGTPVQFRLTPSGNVESMLFLGVEFRKKPPTP